MEFQSQDDSLTANLLPHPDPLSSALIVFDQTENHNGNPSNPTTTTTTKKAPGRNGNSDEGNSPQTGKLWEPTGIAWRDFLHFMGPGWFVSIAYVDPGNYQADILAGQTSAYRLLFAVWWTSVLSIYVQVLCVRLAYYGNLTLAEAQARTLKSNKPQQTWRRYMDWFIAEFSIIITDLPEVIGFGIACNIFFGWPYYVGVLLSLLTTMTFLALQNVSIRLLEFIMFVFVGIMSASLFVEMKTVDIHIDEMLRGWAVGFMDLQTDDIFPIASIIGAVVMPHNLYLHTGACRARPCGQEHVKQAVKWGSIEPIPPILISFFVNLAIVVIATERVGGVPLSEEVGLTTFCSFLTNGCIFWGIALLAAGQSSAITTTFTGQNVMDGFLNLRIPLQMRAIITRLVAITPCVIVSLFIPNHLNQMVNIVNAALSILLPFAFTPLVTYNCSPAIMGAGNASHGVEKAVQYTFAFLVWLVNAVTLSVQGGGFFGDLRSSMEWSWKKALLVLVEIGIQVFYAWWNLDCILTLPDQDNGEEECHTESEYECETCTDN